MTQKLGVPWLNIFYQWMVFMQPVKGSQIAGLADSLNPFINNYIWGINALKKFSSSFFTFNRGDNMLKLWFIFTLFSCSFGKLIWSWRTYLVFWSQRTYVVFWSFWTYLVLWLRRTYLVTAIRLAFLMRYGIWIKQSVGMVFIFNLDKLSLKKLFPTMNI